MNYQLVLQWPGSSFQDYDIVINIENKLIDFLGSEHQVDGHDIGSDEVNIFILTNDPVRAFDEAKVILNRVPFDTNLRVAFRHMNDDQFNILWPKELSTFEIK